jgi:hypothetical protein
VMSMPADLSTSYDRIVDMVMSYATLAAAAPKPARRGRAR